MHSIPIYRYGCALAALGVMIILAAPCALATDYTVGPDPEDDYSTIQAAIDAASSGDTITVDQGTYTERVSMKGKNLTLKSTNPSSATVVAATIISPLGFTGPNADVALEFQGTENNTCLVAGFTLKRAKLAGILGGPNGIGQIQATAVVEDCVIELNGGFGSGPVGLGDSGVLHFNGTLLRCLVRDNLSKWVGGGAHLGDDATVDDCEFTGNTSEWHGGAIYGGGTIKNSIIDDNTAELNGGGIADCDGTIENCTITNNRADDNGGALAYCDGVIDGNTIEDNEAGIIVNNVVTSVGNGGGLWFCDADTRDNTVESNLSTGDGGGFYDCDGTIQRNRIRSNTALGKGGGLARSRGSATRIRNNLIYDNFSTSHGGGLFDCDVRIFHNTIVGNIAGGRGGGARSCGGSNCVIRNNIFWQNAATQSGANANNLSNCSSPKYCCINNWTAGGNKIRKGDPKFTSYGSTSNPDTWVFTLTNGSSCLDKGKNGDGTDDFAGNTRPVNLPGLGDGDKQHADIGAFEAQTAP